MNSVMCEVYMCRALCTIEVCNTSYTTHKSPNNLLTYTIIIAGRCLQVGRGISYAYGKPRYTKCHVTVDVILLKYYPLK